MTVDDLLNSIEIQHNKSSRKVIYKVESDIFSISFCWYSPDTSGRRYQQWVELSSRVKRLKILWKNELFDRFSF